MVRNARGFTSHDLNAGALYTMANSAGTNHVRTHARIDTLGRLAAVFGAEPWTLPKQRLEPSRELAEAAA